MADLIIYIPNHGYSDNDPIYVSWLDYYGYVTDPQTNSFKVDDGAGNNLQFSSTITTGYVREYDDGAGTTTVTGLEHLNGETVYVVAGGESLGTFTVANGSITLQSDVYTYRVGLPYSFRVKTTRLEIPQASTIQSREKNINELVVRHIRTTNGAAGQEKGGVDYLNDIEATFGTISNDSTITVRGGHSPDGYVVIKSDEPYPMTVLATIVSFSVDENR